MSLSIVDIATVVTTLLNTSTGGTSCREYLDGRGFTDSVYDFTAAVIQPPIEQELKNLTTLKMLVSTAGNTVTFNRSMDDFEERINVSVVRKLPATLATNVATTVNDWVKFTETVRDFLKQHAKRTYSVSGGGRAHLTKISINQDATPWLPEQLRNENTFWSVITLTLIHMETP